MAVHAPPGLARALQARVAGGVRTFPGLEHAIRFVDLGAARAVHR